MADRTAARVQQAGAGFGPSHPQALLGRGGMVGLFQASDTTPPSGPATPSWPGAVTRSVALASGPEYIVRQGDRVLVRRHSGDYVIGPG
ncbi:MAG: hypothetical protein AB7J32_01190 [Pseudonocardia sp.]